MNANTNKCLAALVRAEREQRNWTQEHLAEVAGVDVRTIQRLEAKGSHSKETLMNVAAAFDVDSQDLRKRAQQAPEEPSEGEPDPYRVVHLTRCGTGRALLEGLSFCHTLHSDYPENLTPVQANVIGWLLHSVSAYNDRAGQFLPRHTIQREQSLTKMLQTLEIMNFAIFRGVLHSLDRHDLIVTVTGKDDPRIVKANDRVEMLPVLMPRAPYTVLSRIGSVPVPRRPRN